jgi:hypothetical protein
VTGELVLDFDAQKSVVWAGNSGQYLLKPTIKVIDTLDNAIVSGTVENDTGSLIGGARVTAQTYNALATDEKDKVVVESGTQTDGNGYYSMYVAPGTYCIVAYAYVPNQTDNYGVAHGPGCQSLSAPDYEGTYSPPPFSLTPNDTRNVTGTVQTGGNDVTLSFRTGGCDVTTCNQIEVFSLTVPAVPDPYTPVDYTVGLPPGGYQVVAYTDCETEGTVPASVTAYTDTTLGLFEFTVPCP